MIRAESLVIDGLNSRYLTGEPSDTGKDTPTIVFLHDGAWGASADVTWGSVLPLAVEKYRVVASDFLGYGGSAKTVRLDQAPFGYRMRHVWRLLEALDITGPVHLVGNSFGGSVALRTLTDPSMRARVASVCSISGTGGPWRSSRGAELADFDGTRDDIARIVRLLCGDYSGIDEQIDARFRWADDPGHYRCVNAMRQSVPASMNRPLERDGYPNTLGGITTAVLLVEGIKDVLVESGWSAHLCALLPNARAEVGPYPHSPNISLPVQTWALIEQFLADKYQPDNAGLGAVSTA